MLVCILSPLSSSSLSFSHLTLSLIHLRGYAVNVMFSFSISPIPLHSSNCCHQESYYHGHWLLLDHSNSPPPSCAFVGEPLYQVSYIVQQETWLPILRLPHSHGGSKAPLFNHGGEEIEPLPYWRKFISAIQRYLGLVKFLFSDNFQLYGTIRSTWYNF